MESSTPRFDHKLTATLDPATQLTTLSGLIAKYETPLSYGGFNETITHRAFDYTDLNHVFLEIIKDGKRSVIGHSYTDTDKVTFRRDSEGLWFDAVVYHDLDFLINSLASGDAWEVGYSMLVSVDGSDFVEVEPGNQQRVLSDIERIYSVTIRQPKDRAMSNEQVDKAQ